ncbi:ATP-dependent RNA helicase dbp6 [Golovinomyces cichoracearum]|uniref:ATP-dependent RNA helicase n=1 Tax=Golovinomyces cichoracearum TaxID=62708 RepID=A0A420HE64_9PEZI|nr:ATP-dependent RNA helicase dbp6 [Golovinomyces cichoracearum]
MASQFYARYVPQIENNKKSNQSNPIVPSELKKSAASKSIETIQDASASYLRYIPPLKSQSNRPHSSPKAEHQETSSRVVKRKLKHDSSKELSENFIFKETDDQNNPHLSSFHSPAYHKRMVKPALSVHQTQNSCQEPEKVIPPEHGTDLRGSSINTEDHHATSTEFGPQSGTLSGLSRSNNDKVNNRLDVSGGEKSDVFTPDEVENIDNGHLKLLRKRDISFKRIEKISNNVDDKKDDSYIVEESAELHGLTPLPQPVLSNDKQSIALSESLPPWLANPIRIAPELTAEFENFDLENNAIKKLHEKGFTKAFPVQIAAFKLLLHENHHESGDVVISAATGSGKTLSYILPLIRDISKYRVSKLRGLIVLPTRELVTQVKELAETCAAIFSKGSEQNRVKVGTAVGNETMKNEQSNLIEHSLKYDPAGYEKKLLQLENSWQDSEDINGGTESIFEPQPLPCFQNFVDEFKMKVNLLICTPGRLVEHLKSSPGFCLKDVKWLVIDEADKLLDQSFQQWLPILRSEIEVSNKEFQRTKRVRKIVLSATMTKNLGQLAQLNLYRPSFILLEGENINGNQSNDELQKYVLPSSLLEFAIKVEETDIKPLYLLELLKRQAIINQESQSGNTDSEFDNASSTDVSQSQLKSLSSFPLATDFNFLLNQNDKNNSLHGALIFTKSNETAVRLGRLIALLSPPLSTQIGILTSTLPRSTRQQYLDSFTKKKISILIVSDLVSRGLDLPNLAHVINYDLPTSLISYIHRIGRTARAGKVGYGWTLFTDSEAGWFWNEIGRSSALSRSLDKIQRVNIKGVFSDEQRRAYQVALEELGKEVIGAFASSRTALS